MNLLQFICDGCYIEENYYISMKKILFRKLLYDCVIFFLISLMSTSIIIWVFQAVNFLDIMIEDGRDYIVYINYSLLNFPKIISKILPFALFFSFTYVLAKYEINNELLIFWNFGVHKLELINFLIKFSLLVLTIQVILTSYIVPKSQDLSRYFLRNSQVDFFDSFIKPNKFNDTIKGLTIYTESKDLNGKLNNIYLKKDNDGNNYQVTYAKYGFFEKINNITFLILHEGTTFNKINNKITNFTFSKSDYNLNNLSTNTILTTKTQELSTKEILECIKKLSKFIDNNNYNLSTNCSVKNLENLNKEIYKRFVIPLYIPSLIIMALLLILRSKENINFTNYRIIIFITGFITIIISETTLSFINKSFISNLKISILPFILFIILYLSIFYKLKFTNTKTNN